MDQIHKIIHIDMDAFYASIEQRDHPELRGKPLIIGGFPDTRGVVATCSYEARKFGIHSAMPSKTAYRLCPQAVFLRPRMDDYKAVSAELFHIFHTYTDLVEPIAYDEAYLDVTSNTIGQSSATLLAREMKQRILATTSLTASAGVSYNKFLAKIASDWRKPDGLTVITPQVAEHFLARMPVGKFFGIGHVTEQKLHSLGIYTGSDLQAYSEEQLVSLFKERGRQFYHFAHGQDERPVLPNRIPKSYGKEQTLQEDIDDLDQLHQILEHLAARLATHVQTLHIKGKTITLKVRYADFRTITRQKQIHQYIDDQALIATHARELFTRVYSKQTKYRLMGITLSDLEGRLPTLTEEG